MRQLVPQLGSVCLICEAQSLDIRFHILPVVKVKSFEYLCFLMLNRFTSILIFVNCMWSNRIQQALRIDRITEWIGLVSLFGLAFSRKTLYCSFLLFHRWFRKKLLRAGDRSEANICQCTVSLDSMLSQSCFVWVLSERSYCRRLSIHIYVGKAVFQLREGCFLIEYGLLFHPEYTKLLEEPGWFLAFVSAADEKIGACR